MTSVDTRYDVGGVVLDRPFKVRRLGHVGFNCLQPEKSVKFYHELFGFAISDRIDFSAHAPNRDELIAKFGDPGGYFMRYGSDHHSLVLFNKGLREAMDQRRRFAPGVQVNQISWQVGSLEEVSRGDDWLRAQGDEVQRNGRDWPGSNWHTYFYDPDGHTNELFYGMEQIGWQGKSKPEAMEPEIRFREKPALPRRSEIDEVRAALAQGIDINAGQGTADGESPEYDVEGVLLPRPFRITRVGPLGFFVKDVEASSTFYQRHLGFTVTEEATVEGQRCVFLRVATEHHSFVLAPLALRAKLGFRDDSTTMLFGVQVASYRQLREARSFFAERGYAPIDVPQALHTGISYAFHVRDPEGHCVQVSFGMEQLGWQGQPRPASQRPKVDNAHWPETLSEVSLFDGEPFLGPLG
jgi:catechol 2,3-dioxygenase-like lactoylglutathione lyase family enzyme